MGTTRKTSTKFEEVSLSADFGARCIENREKSQTVHKPAKRWQLSPPFLNYPKPVQFDLKPSQNLSRRKDSRHPPAWSTILCNKVTAKGM
jgi:hypothetical protein